MKPSFIFFVVVIILSFTLGYFYHEAINEKIIYERDQCVELIKNSVRY